MDRGNAGQAIEGLRSELAQVKEAATTLSGQLTTLRNQVEPLELLLVRRVIERRRDMMALRAGVKSAFRDKRKLGVGLGLAAMGAILVGAATNDRYSALTAGVSGLRSTLLGFGTSEWATSLDADFRVVPRNKISAGRNWVTLESLLQTLEKLKVKGDAGGCYESVANVIAAIQQTPGLRHLIPSATGQGGKPP